MLRDPSSFCVMGMDATVDLWRELAIDFYFFLAGGFPLLQRRIIQVWKPDGALDLQGTVAFEKNRCRMRIDPIDMRMGNGIRQKGKDALLHARVGLYRSCHAPMNLGFEDRGTQDLSRPKLLQDLVGLMERKHCRLGPNSGLRHNFKEIQSVLAGEVGHRHQLSFFPEKIVRKASECRSCGFPRILPCRPCAPRAMLPVPVLRRARR